MPNPDSKSWTRNVINEPKKQERTETFKTIKIKLKLSVDTKFKLEEL